MMQPLKNTGTGDHATMSAKWYLAASDTWTPLRIAPVKLQFVNSANDTSHPVKSQFVKSQPENTPHAKHVPANGVANVPSTDSAQGDNALSGSR
jgi:hypothetical protein